MIRQVFWFGCCLLAFACGFGEVSRGQDDGKKTLSKQDKVVAGKSIPKPLTEPPCSYCVNQHAKGLVKPDDVVLAWIRGAHNGGAFPLRHFIAKPRVINDTYGLFFYDPDGGYVSAFKKDYGYKFHGWRGGVMVVESADGTLWSALTGRALKGPQKGKTLERVPSMTTTWAHWLMLHPESTAYDLFDGQKYPVAELPTKASAAAMETVGTVDQRMDRFANVLGVEGKAKQIAIPVDGLGKRAVRQFDLEGQSVAVFWYQATRTAVAFSATVDGRKLTFYADEISPDTAPFKDRETGTRWSLAGRGIDGPLRGKELTWVNSVQCRWYAWSHEYPKTEIGKLSSARKNRE